MSQDKGNKRDACGANGVFSFAHLPRKTHVGMGEISQSSFLFCKNSQDFQNTTNQKLGSHNVNQS